MGTKPDTLKTFLSRIANAPDAELLRLLEKDPALARHPSSLEKSSLYGRAALVKQLLKLKADPDAFVSSHEYYRPLHRAIEHRGVARAEGHVSTIKLLLAAGADPEKRSTWMGLNALAVAAMTGDKEIIGILLRQKTVFSVFDSAILGNTKKVTRFLKKDGASCSHDENQMTPLHYVTLSGLKSADELAALCQITTLLCDAGADLNSAPKIGPYPSIPVLHFAAWSDNLPVAGMLLGRGANPDLGFGNCLWREPGKLAELFVAYGANVNGREADGRPYLHSRIKWNLVPVVLWLLERGADPNLIDQKGNTALHVAAARGCGPKILEALIKHGVKISVKNKEGLTAAAVARKAGKKFG